MNNKPTILFDMDGTTFDFRTPLYDLIQKELSLPEQVRKTLSDVTNWTKVGLRDLFDPTEFDRPQLKKQISKLSRNETFFQNLKLYPGMKDLLEELRQTNNIIFCTKPSEDDIAKSESAKRTCIIGELNQSWGKSMTTAHDKTMIRGRLLFDDNPPTEGIYVPERQPIIVDQPHNQGMPGTRVYHNNLEEWKTIIENILIA